MMGKFTGAYKRRWASVYQLSLSLGIGTPFYEVKTSSLNPRYSTLWEWRRQISENEYEIINGWRNCGGDIFNLLAQLGARSPAGKVTTEITLL